MRFNSWNLCDKAILWGLGKRDDEAGGRELLSSQVSFDHFNLTDASCSHLAHHKKKKRKKKKKEKLPAADADRVKHSRCGDSRGDGELTWHDGVRDVEVVQGQAQGLTRGGRGRAGGLGGRPGRFDGRGSRRGVAAGLEPIVLGFERLDLVLCVGKRFRKKKKEFYWRCKSASAAAERDFTAWAGLCCYSESVLFKWTAISAFFDVQGPLCSKGWGSDKEPHTWSPDLKGDYRLLPTRQANVCGNPLNRRYLQGRSLTARSVKRCEKKQKTLNNTLWTETDAAL